MYDFLESTMLSLATFSIFNVSNLSDTLGAYLNILLTIACVDCASLFRCTSIGLSIFSCAFLTCFLRSSMAFSSLLIFSTDFALRSMLSQSSLTPMLTYDDFNLFGTLFESSMCRRDLLSAYNELIFVVYLVLYIVLFYLRSSRLLLISDN